VDHIPNLQKSGLIPVLRFYHQKKKKKKNKLWKIPKDYKLQQQMKLRIHSSAAAKTHDLNKRC
jgi:predicted oxidoreductase (fatty acid repression mutant protein)